MRCVAYAFAVLALGWAMPGPAAAQSYGPDEDGRPPPYDTHRPPPQRAAPTRFDNRSENYRRFWDDGDEHRSRTVTRPASTSRNVVSPPLPPRRSAPDRGIQEERGIHERVVRQPAVREHAAPERGDTPSDRDDPPIARVAIGPGAMVISIDEYRSLREQARELQRLLGARRDFHDERARRDRPAEVYR
jgi:hypothetical protein